MSTVDNDSVVYLNKQPLKFDSRLRQQLEAAKVKKMPTDQWVAFINGLSSKGVKKDEVNDSGILGWLQADARKGVSITKEELLQELGRLMVTVKEVVLGKPQYSTYSHSSSTSRYQEILFIANSELANVEDRLEEIEFAMEDFGFNLERLSEDPEAILRLEKERAELMRYKPKAYGFNWRHFTSSDIQGKHGKNLIAHARVTIHDGLYFIEEIQSDWGQAGRVRRSANEQRRQMGLQELQWNESIPRGPFVTDTKLWAGLVLRRLLQRAAMMPDIDRVAWIRLCMRNGEKTNPGEVDRQRAAMHEAIVARAIAMGEEPPTKQHDDFDHFYMKVIPSLADSALGKSGVKTRLVNETIAGHLYESIPGFSLTPEAREVLKGVQPLYSAASVLRNPRPVPDEELVRLVRRAKSMLGSAAHVRFMDKLYNLKDMTPVSGSYMNRLIHVALNAADLEMALDHEAYHFAHSQLLIPTQQRIVLDAFAPGTELNAKVRDGLLRLNQPAAAAQCSDPEETAAHAFSLWCKGSLDLAESPAKGVFAQIVEVIRDSIRWISSTAKEKNLQTVEEVFTAVRQGDFAGSADAAGQRPGGFDHDVDPQSIRTSRPMAHH